MYWFNLSHDLAQINLDRMSECDKSLPKVVRWEEIIFLTSYSTNKTTRIILIETDYTTVRRKSQTLED